MERLKTDTDVVIVGGGPAGLAAAVAARGKGLRVVVLECAPLPRDKSCGEGLMPDGVAALGNLGVFPDRSCSFLFRGIRFCDRDASVEAAFAGGSGVGVRRTILHDLLVRHASAMGVDLRWGTRATGLTQDRVFTAQGSISCRWIVGADGEQSRVRRWAGLDGLRYERSRFGRRQHFAVAPWTDKVEVHWGAGCQVVITPVGPGQVCAALVSDDPGLRVADAIRSIPALARRLGDARAATAERGAVTAVRVLRNTTRGRIALVGDASGSVDAITGQGLCLAFRQAEALGWALENQDLRSFEAAQRRFARKPVFMSRLMLAMGRMTRVRRLAMLALAGRPGLFSMLLDFHVGSNSTPAPGPVGLTRPVEGRPV